MAVNSIKSKEFNTGNFILQEMFEKVISSFWQINDKVSDPELTIALSLISSWTNTHIKCILLDRHYGKLDLSVQHQFNFLSRNYRLTLEFIKETYTIKWFDDVMELFNSKKYKGIVPSVRLFSLIAGKDDSYNKRSLLLKNPRFRDIITDPQVVTIILDPVESATSCIQLLNTRFKGLYLFYRGNNYRQITALSQISVISTDRRMRERRNLVTSNS